MFICSPRLKKWKKEFTINSNNIKEGIGIQVTFLLEIKLQKEHSKVWQFIQLLTCLFSTLFRMRMWIHMPRLKKKKKVCTINSYNKNQEIGTQVTIILEIKHQMYIFIKKCPFFKPYMRLFWIHVRMGMRTGMPRLKNWKRRTWK